MRYGQTHKQETRAKVLKTAAKALREKGPEGVGVADVMSTAGLTHGGFYAHFPSKDAFLAEALKEVFVEQTAIMQRVTEGLPPRKALKAYIDHYVSRGHRDHPAKGCPLPALNSELPRQSRKFRAVFDEGVTCVVQQFAQWISDAGHENADQLAVSTLSAMAGAVALSRAVSDRRLSDALLESARAGIKARLGLAD